MSATHMIMSQTNNAASDASLATQLSRLNDMFGHVLSRAERLRALSAEIVNVGGRIGAN